MFLRKALIVAIVISLAGVFAYAQKSCCPGGGTCKMAAGEACAMTMDSTKKSDAAYVKMPGFDKKFQVEGYTVSYRFVKRPQIGTIILRVQVFNADKKQVKPFEISGEYGMPSMKGAHDSGLQPFKTNVKGDYLLPVSLVMRGEWEVKMTISDKEKKPVYCGVFKFTI
jgi:hypothetical protein